MAYKLYTVYVHLILSVINSLVAKSKNNIQTLVLFTLWFVYVSLMWTHEMAEIWNNYIIFCNRWWNILTMLSHWLDYKLEK